MAYITHPELAESPGALELAQVASDEHVPPVSAELLDALLRAQDVSAWGPEDVAAATRVIGRIDAAVREAEPHPVARVELFTDTTGDHRWRAIARNGEIVATSGEGYRNAAHARAMAERILPGVGVRDEETDRG